ncbi:MAG: hypothetical protein WCJ84_04370 [Candidatus Peregrinibacteria bacterium]
MKWRIPLLLAVFLLCSVFGDFAQAETPAQKADTKNEELKKTIIGGKAEVKSLINEAKNLQSLIDKSKPNTACEGSFGNQVVAEIQLQWFGFQNFLFAQSDYWNSRCFLGDLEELESLLSNILKTFPRTELACGDESSSEVKIKAKDIQKRLEKVLVAFDQWRYHQGAVLENQGVSEYEKEQCKDDPKKELFTATKTAWAQLMQSIEDIKSSPIIEGISQIGKDDPKGQSGNSNTSFFSFSDTTLARLDAEAQAESKNFYQGIFQTFDISASDSMGNSFSLRLLPHDKKGEMLYGISPITGPQDEEDYKTKARIEMPKQSYPLLSQMAEELQRRDAQSQKMWEDYMKERTELESIIDYGTPLESAISQALDPLQNSTDSATKFLKEATKGITRVAEKQATNKPIKVK